jgi:hypothetical protein
METLKLRKCELFCQYSGQHEPQPVYIYIDCQKELLFASYDPNNDGGWTPEEYHGHTQRFAVEGQPISSEMNVFLQSEWIQMLAKLIIDGYNSVWNGSNYVAEFTESAKISIDFFQTLIDKEQFTSVNYCDSDYMLVDYPQSKNRAELSEIYKDIIEQCKKEFKEVVFELNEQEWIEKVIELNTEE